MKKTLLTLASGLLMAQAGMADPAIYRDGTIFIPHGAHDKGTEVKYFQNIWLQKAAPGIPGLFLTAAEPGVPQAPTLEQEPAVYSGGEMWIERGANIYGDGRGDYYRDVVLQATSFGTFQVTSANRLDLVDIDTVDLVGVDYSYPSHVTLQVTGTASNNCGLEEPAYSRVSGGSVFTVLLAESEVTAEGSCVEQATPINTTVDVPVCDCQPGDYTLSINGEGAVGFTVEGDVE